MLRFAEQAIKRRFHTGAFLPSTRFLAREMTASLRAANHPVRVLEVGPGTGPFTQAILSALQDGDSLTIVEINEVFADQLEKKILAPFRAAHPHIQVILLNKPIEEAPLAAKFNFIVCGLPFNNFPPPLVRSIFRKMLAQLAPGGELTYFEYFGMRPIRMLYTTGKARKKIHSLAAMTHALRRQYSGSSTTVWTNLPPACAIRLHRAAETEPSAAPRKTSASKPAEKRPLQPAVNR